MSKQNQDKFGKHVSARQWSFLLLNRARMWFDTFVHRKQVDWFKSSFHFLGRGYVSESTRVGNPCHIKILFSLQKDPGTIGELNHVSTILEALKDRKDVKSWDVRRQTYTHRPEIRIMVEYWLARKPKSLT